MSPLIFGCEGLGCRPFCCEGEGTFSGLLGGEGVAAGGLFSETLLFALKGSTHSACMEHGNWGSVIGELATGGWEPGTLPPGAMMVLYWFGNCLIVSCHPTAWAAAIAVLLTRSGLHERLPAPAQPTLQRCKIAEASEVLACAGSVSRTCSIYMYLTT